MRILVVDDELVSRKKLQKIMSGFGECEALDSGRAAIAAFRTAWEKKAPFHLVTLDISMPEMDGMEVLCELREAEVENRIPREEQSKIMMVTSIEDRDTRITCIQAGCDDYIPKPFDRQVIIEKIEKCGLLEKESCTADKEDVHGPVPDMPGAIMRILVVDDELVSRKKLQKIMSGFGECEALDSGSAAIAAFRKGLENRTPFDLMTLDITMPEMDGTEVLYEIRRIEQEKEITRDNQVKIIMVTSHSDKDNIITCIQAECDDYIVKPFDREMIAKKLEKIESGKRLGIDGVKDIQASLAATKSTDTKTSIIQEIASSFKDGEITLPSPSQISIKFKQMISAGASAQEISNFLKQDMAISSKLISISNTAYYRGLLENKTLDQAISRLGLDVTRRHVDAISNQSFYATGNKKYVEFTENLWRHSLASAYASQVVCEAIDLKGADDVFTMGLLHDIGKSILLHILGELEKKGRFGGEVESVELLKTLNAHHGRFGAAILKRWGFSNRYIQIAMYHDNLEDADPVSDELLIVHFANLLVKSMGYDVEQQAETDLEGLHSARVLKLDSAMIAEVKDRVTEYMKEIATAFA